MIEFSIIDAADQQFGTIMNGRRVTLRLRYNPTNDRWSFDLSVDNLPVLHSRRIVTGINLLAPFNLGLGAIVALATVAGEDPDRDGLPSRLVRLYAISTEDLEAVRDAAVSA